MGNEWINIVLKSNIEGKRFNENVEISIESPNNSIN